MRSLAWVGPPAGVGWLAVLVLLSSPPVGSGGLSLSSGFVRACSFPFSEKRRRPRAPTQGPVFQQVPFTTEELKADVSLSCPSFLSSGDVAASRVPSVAADAISILLLSRPSWSGSFIGRLIADFSKGVTSNEIEGDNCWRTC